MSQVQSTDPGVVIIPTFENGPTYWRALAPAVIAKMHGYPILYQKDEATFSRSKYRIISLPRFGCAYENRYAIMDWVRRLKQSGMAVISDYDDDVFTKAVLPQSRVMAPDWTEADHERGIEQNIRGLQLVDGVTVTNEALASIVRNLTDRPVEVVPNAIPWKLWQAEMALGTPPAEGLVVGWVGGQRVKEDVEPLAEAWKYLASRNADVTFLIAGEAPDCLYEAVIGARSVIVPWRSWLTYQRSYAGIGILCCPLSDNEFNQCKTPIKAYEGAATGAAVIASPTVYGEVMRHGVDGLLATTAEEWTEALLHMISLPEQRNYYAKTWAARVKSQHNLEATWTQWQAAWRRMYERVRPVARGLRM